MEKLILDTSYFIAYLNKSGKHHSEALSLSKKVEEFESVVTDYKKWELRGRKASPLSVDPKSFYKNNSGKVLLIL
ncbi:hypothetical protein J5U23_01383 [Saccharolobus shibatae B12]|uniref:PIN domain-containing protein n=1 Tax=Saccharolobus shibatae (strain ATCC 51178 / DSM 5389 / JCM 8931 / NBRC 15437 / B12) TaxID=523848 RepID=A0A8F5GT29_SACSH|nr:hypothetical protein [Saccharolobus shibatae]QXJ28514.1 hypothetical protein J5U23_01383 [Saccharolobus shibatae B12]